MAGQGRTGIGLAWMVAAWLVAAGTAIPARAAPGRPGLLPAQSGHPVDDPMAFRGTDEEVTEAFRRGRDEIRAIVASLLPSDNPNKDA